MTRRSPISSPSFDIALLRRRRPGSRPADSGRPDPPARRGPAPTARSARPCPWGGEFRTNRPGSNVRLGLRKIPRTSNVPVAGSICRRDIFDRAVMGIAGLIREPDFDRNFVQLSPGVSRRWSRLARICKHLLLAHIGNHVDRVELGDFGERGLLAVAADDIARIDEVLAHLAVERRPDLGVARDSAGRSRPAPAPPGCSPPRSACSKFQLSTSTCVAASLLSRARVADDLGLGVEQRRLLRLKLRLGLLQLRLVLLLLDGEEKIALLDQRAIAK